MLISEPVWKLVCESNNEICYMPCIGFPFTRTLKSFEFSFYIRFVIVIIGKGIYAIRKHYNLIEN